MAMAQDIPDLALEQAQAAVRKLNQELAVHMSRDPTPQSLIALQTLINKRNEAHAQLTALLRKQQQALDKVVNNMR